MSVERMHWFLREGCNLKRCAYCFGPMAVGEATKENDILLAQELVKEGVKMVILGGGEPLLANNLEDVLRILKNGGVYVSVHTNGLLLTDEKLDKITGLVDEIALPIDTTNRELQAELRGDAFLPVFDKLASLADKINERGINLGWHTVFTADNYQDMPAIYDFIKNHSFKFWRIYEFNDDLARWPWLVDGHLSAKERIAGHARALALNDVGTPERGGTDCTLAEFLKAEEAMQVIGDDRICFVARKDPNSKPYAFLRNSGEVDCYTYYSTNRRFALGNVFQDGLPAISQKLEATNNWGDDDDLTEEWIEAGLDMPLWARIWDGDYSLDEADEVDPRYYDDVLHIANLWLARCGEDVELDSF